MKVQMTVHISYPLPADVSPQTVLEGLHRSYEPLIRPHPYLKRYRRRRVVPSEVVDDPFFGPDGRKIEGYEVIERVPLLPVPGFHKDVVIPAVFQSFETGVRCRADAAAGVRVWSVYEVRPCAPQQHQGLEGEENARGWAAATYDSGRNGAAGTGWELFETAKVECSSLIKPFVMRSFENAHHQILKGTVQEILRMDDPMFF